MPIQLICLDADDTLWHTETFFRSTHADFVDLVQAFGSLERLEAELDSAVRRNLTLYGYGAKGFTLSMIEAALAFSGNALPGGVVARILDLGRSLMRHPITPLPGVAPAVAALSQLGRLVLVTKGDLLQQEAKLAASGLGPWFFGVEVVSEKVPDTYRRVFRRYGVPAEEAVMAGNSVRSDILPALKAGAYAALVPYPLVWAHEAADAPHGHPRLIVLDSLAELPAWLQRLEGGSQAPDGSSHTMTGPALKPGGVTGGSGPASPSPGGVGPQAADG